MYDFKFADIGEGIHEGVILEWKYNVGDQIKEGETIVIIETDKVNAEIPSPTSGTIITLGPKVGETIHVGETIAVINDGTETKTETKPITEGEEENAAGVVGTIEVSNEVIASSNEHRIDTPKEVYRKVLATPVARKLAKDLGVDITQLKGTGINGRIMKEDIYNAKEETKEIIVPRKMVEAPQITSSNVTREKISKIRKTISENMTLSKQMIPHTTIMDEVIVSDLVQLRNSQKDAFTEQNLKLTYMPFIIKALTTTLKEHPLFNSSFDHTTDEIIYKHYMNIGVAVDTKDGLIVPNIKNANEKSIVELSKELAVIKEKSETKTFTLNDLKDGTISITNYGIFDSTFGAPVIKYPEVAIIGIGKISQKPVVKNNEIVIEFVLPLSLSIDHRVIDGGDAGRFLKTLKSYLTNPMMILMN